MSFGRYPQETYNLAHEILGEFREEDIALINSTLRSIGIEGWLNWKEEHQELISQYVNATPSQRKKQKSTLKSCRSCYMQPISIV